MTDAVLTAIIGSAGMVIVELIRRGPAKKVLVLLARIEKRQQAMARHIGVEFDDAHDRVIVLRKSAAQALEYQDEIAK